jgi:hypothetical protein
MQSALGGNSKKHSRRIKRPLKAEYDQYSAGRRLVRHRQRGKPHAIVTAVFGTAGNLCTKQARSHNEILDS